MKKLTTAALLVGGAIMASQSVFGQTYSSTPNALDFGFQNQAGGGTEDYIINLGAASSIIGQTSVVNLSSDFSTADFDAVLGGSSGMLGGVVGAANTSTSGTANTADVFLTQLRVGGAGSSPAVAGSSVSQQLSRAQDNTTFANLGTLVSPTAGTGTLDTSKSWENLVDPNNATGTFQSNTGLNPDSSVGTSSVLYEDLWETSSSSLSGTKPFNYLGYFTLNASTGSLTFTGVDAVTAVPEPATYGMLAGVGVLLIALRRQLTGVIA